MVKIHNDINFAILTCVGTTQSGHLGDFFVIFRKDVNGRVVTIANDSVGVTVTLTTYFVFGACVVFLMTKIHQKDGGAKCQLSKALMQIQV